MSTINDMSKWLEALLHVASGNSSKQIASLMDISIDAVTKNLERARGKLSAKTTAEAVYKAAKSGLIAVLIVASFSNAMHVVQPLARVNKNRSFSRLHKSQVKSHVNAAIV